MKKHAYLYAFLFCLVFFLPTKSFAFGNHPSIGINTSASVVHFGEYGYQFYREQNQDQFLSIYRSSDGRIWNKLEQTIAKGAYLNQDSIVYKNALYISIPYRGTGHRPQIWKTTDSTNFTNVVDKNDSLVKSAVRSFSDFFTINGKLCIIAQNHKNAHLQTHCSEDGESWTAQNDTGYFQDIENRINGIQPPIRSNGKIYAIIGENRPRQSVIVSSLDGIDWQLVDKGGYPNMNGNQMVHFNDELYIFMPSYEGSGVRIFKIKNDQLIPVEHRGITKMRGVRVAKFDTAKKSLYILGKVVKNGATKKCLYHSSDLYSWDEGVCYSLKTQRTQYQQANNLYSFGDKMYLGNEDVTFE